MRIALISDIHANLVALEAVLRDLDRQSVDQIICLGDVAASGPQPHEALSRLRALSCPVVMGNTDAWLLQPQPYAGVESFPRRITEINSWCAQQLTPADLEDIGGFQETIELPLGKRQTLFCYHGSPRASTDRITQSTSEEELARLLAGFHATVMAGGHTHVQMLRRFRQTVLINPGSVGLPFEQATRGDSAYAVPWAEYALVDGGQAESDGLRVEFRRVPLDTSAVERAALESGMPHAAWWAAEWER